jgi:nucleotide-binding universal stress UspA family protein
VKSAKLDIDNTNEFNQLSWRCAVYKSILVPLDGSKRAEKILPHVKKLAQCTGAKVILMQVVIPVYYMMDPQISYVNINVEETQWRLEEAKDYLEKLAQEFSNKTLKVDVLVEQGPVVESIIETAQSLDASIIALASHGRSGLGQVFYGSVTAGILQRVDRPLLVVRSRD